ncbi:hypothetical protein ACXYTP_23545 [Tsukamurella ocularis]
MTGQLQPLPDWFGDVAHQAARIALIEEDIPVDVLDSPELNDALGATARAAAAIALEHFGIDHLTPVPDPWKPADGAPPCAGPVAGGDRRTARDYENAVQRADPHPNFMTVWDSRFIAHVDLEAIELSGLRFRVRTIDRPRVQEFVRDHDGDLCAQWRGGPYRLAEVIAARGYLDLVLEPYPPMPGDLNDRLAAMRPRSAS